MTGNKQSFLVAERDACGPFRSFHGGDQGAAGVVHVDLAIGDVDIAPGVFGAGEFSAFGEIGKVGKKALGVYLETDGAFVVLVGSIERLDGRRDSEGSAPGQVVDDGDDRGAVGREE